MSLSTALQTLIGDEILVLMYVEMVHIRSSLHNFRRPGNENASKIRTEVVEGG